MYSLQYGVVKRCIPDMEVIRSPDANLKEITEHLETYLLLP